MNEPSAHLLALALVAVWCGFGLAGLFRVLGRSRQFREALGRFRQARLATKAAVVAALAAIVAVGGTKPGGNPPLRGVRRVNAPAPQPAAALVEVRTNGVSLFSESASAVEMPDWRLHGSADGGFWLDFDEPFFRIGTNPVSRVRVSAGGVLSFSSARRPPAGAALPDGTALPVLAPLLAPLGMVPEANWISAGAESRFWHDAAPDRGRVFTWENALLDRLPGRRVSVQAELRPTGDFAFRYDFKDALDPPADNLVVGAQMGTNGVNALAILGTNLLSETVWRVDGSPVPDGALVSDLLCTDGVLAAPSRFALEWRNATGLDRNADTDGDGLSDWDEIFVHATDPSQTDTDGDGISDAAEILAGADPRNADEDGDGVPDGVSAAAWAANPLWAGSSESADFTIVLSSDLPAGTAASLVLGDLTIPLSTAGSWNIDLPAGQLVHVRLFSTGTEPVPLSLVPAGRAAPRLRLRSGSGGSERYRDDPDGIFDGNSRGGEANLAQPTLRILREDGTEAPVSQCLHGAVGGLVYTVEVLPAEVGITVDDAELDGFKRLSRGRLALQSNGATKNCQAHGSVSISDPLDYGTLNADIWIHDCDEDDSWWCRYCLMWHTPENGCWHDPDCAFGSDHEADCTCPPRVLRVAAGTNTFSLATRFVGVTHCCCPPEDSAEGAILESAASNLVVENASGPLSPGDRIEGPVFVHATAASGSSPSEIHYRLVGGSQTNLASRVAKFWAVSIRHEPVATDRNGSAYFNPCGIVAGETAAFRFSIEPASFPSASIGWSVDRPDRVAFVSGTNGASVVVRGTSPGPVKLTAGIVGYAGPPPVFYAGVVQTNAVRVKAFVVDGENGQPIRSDESVASLFPGANRIFSQVGLSFHLDPAIGHIADTNYLDIMKADGTYPLGLSLVNHASGTGGVEVYFVRHIEGAVGLSGAGGIILGLDAGDQGLAHELGHACGLGDVYDKIDWVYPTENERRTSWDWSLPARDRMPHDWGTDSEEGYCGAIGHRHLVRRMLMCGRVTGTNEDITYGDVKGLVPVSETDPPVDGTSAIGFFTVPGRVPVHP